MEHTGASVRRTFDCQEPPKPAGSLAHDRVKGSRTDVLLSSSCKAHHLMRGFLWPRCGHVDRSRSRIFQTFIILAATLQPVETQQAPATDPQCAAPCLGATCGKFRLLLTCTQISDQLRCNCAGCCLDTIGNAPITAQPTHVATPGTSPTPGPQRKTEQWLMPGSGSSPGLGAKDLTSTLYGQTVSLDPLQGACRSSAGAMGASLSESWNIHSAANCQGLCATETACNGFQFAEFRASGVGRAYTVCKLFSELATHTLPLTGHVCFYKVSSGVTTSVPATAGSVPATLPVRTGRTLPVPTGTVPLPTGTATPLQPAGSTTPTRAAGPSSTCLFLIQPYTDFAQHNCWDMRNLDLSYADLTGARLDNVDISGSTLAYASFVKADFAGMYSAETIFEGANFTQSILQGCEFEKGNFEEASLAGADARGSKFIDCSLSGAQLTAVTLQDTVLFKTSFRGATLNYAQLRGSEAETVDFSNANLVGADFTSAKLFESSFKNAVLHGAVFRDAWLEKADFTGATGLESATFTGSSGSPVGLAFNFPKTTSTPPIG
mmetsp:Transcript_25061/g.54724  ORF Transcript_25061/g.54724 Transcript_25061/m.54724 type:complete len:549 (+) Transcript_25061:110-1756(+)